MTVIQAFIPVDIPSTSGQTLLVLAIVRALLWIGIRLSNLLVKQQLKVYRKCLSKRLHYI
jgi:hypothetical protein